MSPVVSECFHLAMLSSGSDTVSAGFGNSFGVKVKTPDIPYYPVHKSQSKEFVICRLVADSSNV